MLIKVVTRTIVAAICLVCVSTFAVTTAWSQTGSQSSPKPPKPSTALVEGKVVSSVNGSALKKTVLTLRPQGRGSTATTETDEEGRFSFPEVQPGSYWLIGERTGYARQYYNARSGTSLGAMIPLQAGDEIKNITFKLAPNAIISGRVLDEDGDPMGRAMVVAMRYMYRTGGKQLQPAGSASTGANGEYSMSVPPGRYVLMAVSGNTMMISSAAQATRPPADAPELAYSTMYYPTATDETGASAFDAGAGMEVSGMDFHLLKVKTFRVRGKIADSTLVGGILQLIRRSGPTAADAPGNTKMAPVRPDGTFEFIGVTPGIYDMMLQGRGGISISSAAVTVGDRHIEGLSLVLSPMGTLSGTVTIAEDKDLSLKGIQVGFDSYDNTSNPSAWVDENGKFSISFILPGRYHPWVAYPPKNGYAKSIVYGGRDIKDGALDISAGISGPVDFNLSLTGASLTGTVRDEDGKPFPGATVVLVPDSRNYLQHYSINTDYQGQFRFGVVAIRPGSYKILALDDVIYLAWFDPEFLKQYAKDAVEVSFTENENKTLSLKLTRAAGTQR